MPLRVLRAGPRTTVQDLGRLGSAHLGVPRAGAVDRDAHRCANYAAGNPASAATLEITLGGLLVEAVGELTVAVAGATAEAALAGRPVDALTAVRLADGEPLAIGQATRGVYIYLAVRGGIDAVPVFGSRSTDTLTGIGPAPLVDGDIVSVGVPTAVADGSDQVEDRWVATTEDEPIRLTPGPHADLLPGVLAELTGRPWRVTPAADRTGLRLQGDPLGGGVAELRSEGLVEGAVQVPGDGQPIVFLANHPTTGGYPVAAVVRHGDIGRVAQSRPGAAMRFTT